MPGLDIYVFSVDRAGFDNMYDSTIVSPCSQCSRTGICQVCGGTGFRD